MSQMEDTLRAKALSPPLLAPARPTLLNRQVLWVLFFLGLLIWALFQGGVFQQEIVNTGGFTIALQFLSASLQPQLDGEFIRLTLQATLTTLAFAVIGLFLSAVFGFFGGIFASHTWARSFTTARAGQELPPFVRAVWLGFRWILTLFRSVHEIVWALIFVAIIGLDPLSAILAIAIPFAAIFAKIFSEIIDETGQEPFNALLNSGVTPAKAFLYGLLPLTFTDLISYSFYRFECAIRAAAVLGIVGVGGLGYQIFLSLQTLKFPQIWTLLIALLALNGAADLWSSVLRRRLGTDSRCAGRCLDLEAVQTTRNPANPIFQDRVVRASILIAVLLVPLSFWYVNPDFSRLFSERSYQNLLSLARDAVPPDFTIYSLGEWLDLTRTTLAMSFLGVALAGMFAILVAFPAANTFLIPTESRSPSHARRIPRIISAAVLVITRVFLLIMRSIPAPIWALLLLFILFPGILPGAMALGIYTLGVLGRLLAEVVENLDQRPLDALKAQGAPKAGVFMYGALPAVMPRFTSYFLYRWEEIIRATVVVGLVGAGGLGRSLTEQLSGFNYPAVFAVLVIFILITFSVDLISQSARKSLRQVG
jgi:phosphonate transport system permease protein